MKNRTVELWLAGGKHLTLKKFKDLATATNFFEALQEEKKQPYAQAIRMTACDFALKASVADNVLECCEAGTLKIDEASKATYLTAKEAVKCFFKIVLTCNGVALCSCPFIDFEAGNATPATKVAILAELEENKALIQSLRD